MKGLDKNAIIGFILIGIILFTYMYINRPTEAQLEQRRQEILKKQENPQTNVSSTKDSVTKKDTLSASVLDSIKKSELYTKFGPFAPYTQGKSRLITVENEVLKLTFDTKGGNLVRVELKDYKTYYGKSLVLFEGNSNKLYCNFAMTSGSILNTDELYFTVEGDTNMKLTGDKQSQLAFVIKIDEGNYIKRIFTLQGNSYVVGMDLQIKGLKNILANNSYELFLHTEMLATERKEDLEDNRMNSTLYYNWAGDVDRLSYTSNDLESETQNGTIYWVSHKVKYFCAALIAGTPTLGMKVESYVPQNENIIKVYTSRLSVGYTPGENTQHKFRLYLGPNDYHQLKAVAQSGADGFYKQLGLGWFILKYVNMYIIIPLFNMFEWMGINYGINIILLAIAIRLILLPLNWKSYISGAKMRILAPQLEPIREKYKDDPTRQQQEILNFYRRAGVNPLGGCVPILLQLPILFAVLQFFPQAIEFRQQSFLWAKDLSTYDSILNLGFKIPFYGDHVSLFTLLMTGATILYTYITNKTQTNPQYKQMLWISYLMPIIFLGYFNSISAALSFYYFVSTMLSIIQQELIKRVVDEKKLLARIQANQQKSANKSEVKSALQRKLEELQKRQAQRAKTGRKF
ncbi:MAG: membrane protein insertase YidC [Bacteroidia bacterium]|nr:membrane protein insertase YidC [Bacteroidia bacterium]